jgi:hypothetical protein
MPPSGDSVLDELDHVLRDLAVQQGSACATYGEALQRFGERKLGWGELFKIAGDTYLRETSRTALSLWQAEANMVRLGLSLAGAKPVRTETTHRDDEAPTQKPMKRGRR